MFPCCKSDTTDKEPPLPINFQSTQSKPYKQALNDNTSQPSIEVDHSAFDNVDLTYFNLNAKQLELLKSKGVYDFRASSAELMGTEANRIERDRIEGVYKCIAQVSQGKLNGKAHFQFNDGNFFIGTFKEDNLDGTGVAFHTNGDYFTGRFKNNLREEGTLYCANGDQYQGAFKGDLYNGQGKLTYRTKKVYEGGFQMGLKSGEGRMQWPDGAWYNGGYKEDKQHGFGTYVDSTGNKYEGEFEAGVLTERSRAK